MAARRDDKSAPSGKATSRPVRVEYPHDESYTPGYHEGGSRFGFFNGHDDARAPEVGRKAPDKG